MVALLAVQAPLALAGVALEQLRTERQDKALQVQARLKLELASAVEEALLKGVAVHFVAEATLMRERWYWTNQKLAQVSRHYRLSFQPLTRQWRVQVSAEPVSGGVAAGSLAQSFDTLQAALDVIGRQTGWTLMEPAALDPESRYELIYSFRLDVAQLPRPFQFAIGNQSDWSLSLTQSQSVQPLAGP